MILSLFDEPAVVATRSAKSFLSESWSLAEVRDFYAFCKAEFTIWAEKLDEQGEPAPGLRRIKAEQILRQIQALACARCNALQTLDGVNRRITERLRA